MKSPLTVQEGMEALVAEVMRNRLRTWGEVREAIKQHGLDESLACEAIGVARALVRMYEQSERLSPNQLHLMRGDWAVINLLESRMWTLVGEPSEE